MKSDPTTNVLLGIIAAGVAAMAAIAFERRYQRSLRYSYDDPDWDDAEDATSHAYDRIRRQANQAGRTVKREAASLRERFEDGVDQLKDKAVSFKERVSDSMERIGSHLHDGAEKLKDGLADGAQEIKDGVQDASEEARRAARL